MRIAVVDYGSGNLASASRALSLAAERLGLAGDVTVTADPDRVASADRIVLPGQGAFADCSRGLDAVSGMHAAIETATRGGTPLGEEIRTILLHGIEMSAWAEAALFASSRAEHVEQVIRPALERGASACS